ncbi:hypothetical protein BOSP111201_02195 [Bordetella sputigena]
MLVTETQSVFTMSNLSTPLQQYLSAPIGEQMRPYLDRRAAVRRDVPLLPRRWAELIALWRRPTGTAKSAAMNKASTHNAPGRASENKLASQGR